MHQQAAWPGMEGFYFCFFLMWLTVRGGREVGGILNKIATHVDDKGRIKGPAVLL